MSDQPSNGRKVFLVEDDKFMSDLLVKEFSSKGYDITHVANGEEVFTILGQYVPDIFVLDVLLPGISGFDVLKKIKDNPVWKDIPAIFLSNMQSKEDLERSKALGATAYFIKALVTPRMVIE